MEIIDSINWITADGQQKNIDTQLANTLKIGKVTRTATVVVGLQSSGYTSDQVDVLILPTDNIAVKINEAINKLPIIGGEIKFLEGEYTVNYNINLNKSVHINGCGQSTKFIGLLITNTDNRTIQLSNFRAIKGTHSDPSFLYVGKSTKALITNIDFTNFPQTINLIYTDSYSSVYISNCYNTVITNKNSEGWQNIWLDGVASNPDGSITMWQDGRMEIRSSAEIAPGAGSANIIMPATFINTNYTVFTTNGYSSTYHFFISIGPITRSEFIAYASESTVIRTFGYNVIGRWK